VPDVTVFYRVSGCDSLSTFEGSHKKLESQFLSMKLHIAYLLSLEESERARAAAVKYLQTWFIWFFEEKPDLARELEQLAVALGGRLEIPKLSWEYLWVQKLFGWTLAKQVCRRWNRYKSSIMRYWDKALFRLKRGKLTGKSAS
jgi:hypothetical protein